MKCAEKIWQGSVGLVGPQGGGGAQEDHYWCLYRGNGAFSARLSGRFGGERRENYGEVLMYLEI